MTEQPQTPRPKESYWWVALLMVLGAGLTLLVLGWIAGRAGFP